MIELSLVVLVVAFILVLLLVGTYGACRAFGVYLGVGHWPEADGVIQGYKVNEIPGEVGSSWSTDVLVAYQVPGRTLTLPLLGTSTFGERQQAERAADADYPIGKGLRVRYDPRSPDRARALLD